MLKDAVIFSLYKSHLHQNDHKSLRQNRHYLWFQPRLADPVQVFGLTDSSAVYIFSNKILPLYDRVQRIHHECHSHLELNHQVLPQRPNVTGQHSFWPGDTQSVTNVSSSVTDVRKNLHSDSHASRSAWADAAS